MCWTEVLGSDAHHPTGSEGKRFPGSHYTWVKMGQPNLEGLRLALLDGALAVKRCDKVVDPNRHATQTLESFEVSDSRYMGRGQSLTIAFNPWLNAIIGGRGTGKSTVVGFLRTTLRRRNEIPPQLKEELEKYDSVYTSRDDDGLLTGNTKLIATYRKDHTRFRVQWQRDGRIDSILEEDD